MDFLIPLLTQLANQAPILLTYVLGIILTLVFWRRAPGPSSLTLIAMLLLLGSTLVQSFLFQYLLRAREDWGWNHEQLGWALTISGFIWSVVRALALGLLLAAVYSGRSVRNVWQPSAPVSSLPPIEPISRPSDEHGITTRPGG